MKKALLSSILLICTCLCGCGQEKVQPLFPCSSRMVDPYGVCAHFTQTFWDAPYQDDMIELAKAMGVTNIRNDYWLPYTENFIQDELAAVIKNSTLVNLRSNIDILPILYVGQKNDRPWDKLDMYEKTLDYYLQEYSNMNQWEVLNEIDMAGKKDGILMDSVARAYMKLLPMTYAKIKEHNPKTLVTSSGAVYVHTDLMKELCKLGFYDYFDILNFHVYDVPESLPKYFKKIRAAMDEYGWEKPVWMTEFGRSTELYKDQEELYNLEREKEQAQWVARAYLISFAYGLDRVYWYSLRSRGKNSYKSENHYGLLHSDLTPKPGYYAYKTLTTMCPSGSTRPTLTKLGSSYLSSWKTNKNKRVWAVWNSKRDKDFDMIIKGKCTFYDHLGNKINKPETYGQGVIYIVGAKSVTFE